MTRQEYRDELLSCELQSYFEIADWRDMEDSDLSEVKARYGQEIGEAIADAEQQMTLRLDELKATGSVEIDRSWFPIVIMEIGVLQREYLNILLTRYFESSDFELVKTRFEKEINAIFEEHEQRVTLNLKPLLGKYVRNIVEREEEVLSNA
tara:strand:- start:94 stop:546 length:453 start_codon:yes stop_codon:yes gene_type:complete